MQALTLEIREKSPELFFSIFHLVVFIFIGIIFLSLFLLSSFSFLFWTINHC
jgi:hypothetical protein